MLKMYNNRSVLNKNNNGKKIITKLFSEISMDISLFLFPLISVNETSLRFFISSLILFVTLSKTFSSTSP